MADSLIKALHAFQAEAPALQKNAINPHFRNRYISLDALMDAILPPLNKAGIVLLQMPTTLEGGTPALTTRLVHADTGEALEATMPLVLEKENPQGQGSAITYARRYSLMAMLGLVADEDDDANAASKPGAGGSGVAPQAAASFFPAADSTAGTPSESPPAPAGLASDAQKKAIYAIGMKLHEAGKISDDTHATLLEASKNPQLSKAKAGEIITRLKELEEEMGA